MKKLSIILLLAMMFASISLQAQTKKVAMLEPVGTATAMQKGIIRASLAEALINSGEYEAFTRTDIDQILKESDFQKGGMVSDAQRQRIDQLSGAQLLCVVKLIVEGSDFLAECSLIEMKTGKIEKTVFELMETTPTSKLKDGCIKLAAQLAGGGGGGGARPSGGGSSGGGAKRNGAAYNPDGIELVYVEGSGSGITATKGFYIGKYEVTQGQWRAIMGSNPSNFKGDNLPVEMVSWNDAQEFLTRLNSATGRSYRLPSETEWEYAASGGTATKFCPGGCEYSGSGSVDNVAWYDGNSGQRTHQVGAKAPNELGIYDMSGNVWEWCQDLYDSSGSYRVLRGGSYNNFASDCRVASRGANTLGDRRCQGLRVLLP
jgi:hypothetical protein